MKLLLDTHAFLWFATADERLSRRARREIEREDAEIYLSAASVWEMAIKASLGRLTLPGSSLKGCLEAVSEQGFLPLPVEWDHAAAVSGLPFHHRDPFDRLLVAQSLTEDLPLVSIDPAFKPYGVKTIW